VETGRAADPSADGAVDWSAVLTPECGLHAARRLHRLVWSALTPERADSTTDRRAAEVAGAGLPPDGDGAPMGAEPEVVMFNARVIIEGAAARPGSWSCRSSVARALNLAMVPLTSLVLVTAGTAQQPATGDEALPRGFKTTPVLKSAQTADNQKIEYPKTGQAEGVSVIGELQPDGRTARHQHPVLVYVLEGTLTVQADGGAPREFAPGTAYMEHVNHWHQALNNGTTPVRILVVFVAEEGKPTTVNAK
jgi:quercetin dioxygenase-like cupin family protein